MAKFVEMASEGETLKRFLKRNLACLIILPSLRRKAEIYAKTVFRCRAISDICIHARPTKYCLLQSAWTLGSSNLLARRGKPLWVFSSTGSLCPEVCLQGAKQATWAGGGGPCRTPGKAGLVCFSASFTPGLHPPTQNTWLCGLFFLVRKLNDCYWNMKSTILWECEYRKSCPWFGEFCAKRSNWEIGAFKTIGVTIYLCDLGLPFSLL